MHDFWGAAPSLLQHVRKLVEAFFLRHVLRFWQMLASKGVTVGVHFRDFAGIAQKKNAEIGEARSSEA